MEQLKLHQFQAKFLVEQRETHFELLTFNAYDLTPTESLAASAEGKGLDSKGK